MKLRCEGFDLVRKIKSLEMNSVMSSNKQVWLSNANKLAFLNIGYVRIYDFFFSVYTNLSFCTIGP